MRREPTLNSGLLAGSCVLVSGFGAFCFFWAFGNWPGNVPGLWEYRSATIGDAVLLPLTIGLLVAAGSGSPRTRYRDMLLWASAIFGTIIGAGIQLAWLLDPSPQLNWGVPSPGHFNVAGIYHAVFFTAICGVLSGLTVRLLIRLRSLRDTSPRELRRLLESPYAALLVACSAGFVGLVVLDGQGLERYGAQRNVTSLSASISALVAIILLATLVVASLGTATLSMKRAFSWGAVLAGSLILTSWRPRHYLDGLHSEEWAVLTAFSVLFAFQLWAWRDTNENTGRLTPIGTGDAGWTKGGQEPQVIRRKRRARVNSGQSTNDPFGKSAFWWVAAATAVLIATAGAGFGLRTASHAPLLAMLVAAASWAFIRILLIAPTAILGLRQHILTSTGEADRIATLLSTAFLLPLSLLMLARWLGGGGTASWHEEATSPVVGAALTVLGFLGLWRYNWLFKQDIDLGPGRQSEKNAWATHTTMLGLFFATLIGIFGVLREASPLISIDPRGAHVIHDSPKLAVAGAIALGVVLFGALTAKRTLHSRELEPSFHGAHVELRAVPSGLTVIALVLWASAPWILMLLDGGIRLRSTIFPNAWWEATSIVFVLLASGWNGYISANSITANIAEIEFLRLSLRARVVAAVAGLATASTALWVFVQGAWSAPGLARIDSLAFATSIVAIGNFAILSATALVFERSWPRVNGSFPFMALHHPATNVANDHLMQTAYLFIALTTSYLGWRALFDPLRGTGDVVVALAAILLPFTVARVFVAALAHGAEEHIFNEGKRLNEGKAEAILNRAGRDPQIAQRLNSERLDRIRFRFNRIQFWSKFLALYVPAALTSVAHWMLRDAEGRSRSLRQ